MGPAAEILDNYGIDSETDLLVLDPDDFRKLASRGLKPAISRPKKLILTRRKAISRPKKLILTRRNKKKIVLFCFSKRNPFYRE
jgi:hypothetical protein